MSGNQRAHIAAQALLRSTYLAAAASPEFPAVRMTLRLANGTPVGEVDVDLKTLNALCRAAEAAGRGLPRPSLRLITNTNPEALR